MRSVNSATSNYLNARAGVITSRLVWIKAKNRTTGAPEEIGFWTGLEDLTFSVISGQDGSTVNRLYVGTGKIIDVSDINLVSDMTLQTVRISLSKIDTATVNAIRGYDARNADVEIHYALFDVNTRQLVDTPYPHFVGKVNKSPIKTPKIGGEGSIKLEAVSRARELTLTNPAKKSDEMQKLRSSDRARRYSSVAGQWPIWWGEDKETKVITSGESVGRG